MSQDTNVNNLIINKLTKAQYEGISNPSDTELYLITDDSGITSNDVTEALGYTPENQANKVTSVSSSSTDAQYPSAKLVYDQLQLKQNELVSGTNIKTINNQSILGNGNIEIQEGGEVDQTYDATSANAQSGTAVAGALSDYVTIGTNQNITGEKTFVGNKRIKFKGTSSSSKLGFTAYDNSNREVGYLEGAGTGDTSHSFRLGIHDETSTNYDNILGFEYYKEKGTDGSLHHYNLLCPPLYPSTTSQDFYIPMSVTNGTLTVNADNKGSVNISSLLPDTSDFVTSSTLSSTLEDYQPLLVSGTSIKTINGISLLGSGNITIEGGGGGTVDQVYDPTSTNAQSGVAIAGAHFLTSSDLPTIGNGEITVYQGSSVKGSFRLNQTSNYSLNLDEGANFESLRTPIPPQGFIPEGSSSTYPVMSLECIVTYTEETDPDTGDPVVDPETGMTSMTIGEILYYDMNTSSFYTFNGGGFDLYQGEVTDPYMSVGDFSASAGLLYRKWSYTDSSSSIESPTVEYYYTYGEIGGSGSSLSTYNSSGKYVGTTDITLSIDETGSGVIVSATLHDSDYMTNKALNKEWSGDIYSSSEYNAVITNSDGTLVANMGMKQNTLIPGENISIDYTTNTISANIGTMDYLNEYSESALSSRGAYYALTTKENILSSENTGDGVEITIEKGHNLPEGYTEYATLNCRNAYINTGLYGSEKTRFEIYGHYQYGDTSYTNLFGDRTTSGKHMCLYNGAWRVGSQNVSSYIFYNSYGSQSDHLFIGNQYGCIYDNTKDAFSTPSAFTTTNTLLLMGVNGSSPTVSSQTFYFRYAKIYEEDTLVFYGVPAKRNSDSAMGIYDLVSKGFFEKAGGSGSFSAGTALSLSKRIVAKGGGGTVDQTYDATSANAQSGVAIAGELVNYMPLNSSSDIDIYANSINFNLSDKLTLNSASVLCQGWNSLSDNVEGFGINIDTDGLWYSWNYNHTLYADHELSGMYGYEYGSNNTISHKHGIAVYGNGISFSNLNYESTITIPSDGSLALNGHNIITDNNLKTINNQSIIGSGNINISGGTTYTEGNGIDITNDTISIDTSVVATQTDISDMATQTWVGNQGYLTSSALTNYVTTNTAQDISGRKTFLGEKAIYFKQVATSNKLGFTLYNPSGGELAALEYRPNTINGASILALNCPQTTGGYVGFRYWGTPAVNIVAPKVATAGNYFMATHITNGNTTVTANNQGTVNISSLLPDVSNYVTNTSLATTLADYVTNSALTTTLADYALSADIPTKMSDLTNDSNFATVSQIPTNNNQLTNGAGYITNSALTPYVLSSSLATVATTGSYNDLTDKPYIPSGVVVDQTYDATSQNAQSGVAIAGAGFLTGITSGDVTTALGYTPYNSSNPSGYQANKIETIKVNGTAQTITSKAVDITVPTNNNQLTNGAGYITSSALNGYAKTADLATVATSGSYNDLDDKPTIPAAQVNADWNATSGVAQILNKPTIPAVGNGTVTINQGGTQKGTFTLNQNGNATINLDAGGTVDQTFDSTSQNAQSGVAIAGAGFLTSIPSSYLQNAATDTNALSILSNNSNGTATTLIGVDTVCSAIAQYGTAIGYHARLGATSSAIQLGYGTNSTANSFNVGFYNNSSTHYNWQLLDGTTGLIPDTRISSNIARTSNVANTDLSNLSATGQTIIDGKVSKSDVWYDSTSSTLYIGVAQS